jgi:hypothetical protein
MICYKKTTNKPTKNNKRSYFKKYKLKKQLLAKRSIHSKLTLKWINLPLTSSFQ